MSGTQNVSLFDMTYDWACHMFLGPQNLDTLGQKLCEKRIAQARGSIGIIQSLIANGIATFPTLTGISWTLYPLHWLFTLPMQSLQP